MTVGALSLDPVFDSETLAYAVATSNATNVVTATSDDPTAEIVIDLDGSPLENGTAATWGAGENIVTITVTDGTSETEYVVTVTKS